MHERTMISHRLILDGISSALNKDDPSKVFKININRDMIKSCRLSNSRYKNYLAEVKLTISKEQKKDKKALMRIELQKEQEIKERVEKKIERMICEVDGLVARAENENKMKLVIESNGIRKRAIDLREEVDNSRNKIRKLESALAEL